MLRKNSGGARMSLEEKRQEQLKRMPIVETKILKSQDGRFLVHKTVITDIKPVEYYRVVLEKDSAEAED